MFDEGELGAALAELDERYVAGEGAEHAQVAAANVAWFQAINTFDSDAMRNLAAPSFVYVDHRLLSAPPLDIDGLVAWQDGYRDVLANGFLAADLHVRGRVSLVTAVNRAVDADGGEFLWSFLIVGLVDDHGRAVRIEAFAVEDRDAAIARFEELRAEAEQSGPPEIANVATRVHARVIAAIGSDDQEALADLVAPEFVHDDQRRVVNMGRTDRRGAAGYLPELRAQGFEWAPPTAIAVRGERLGFIRSVFRTEAGDDSSSLAVVESDEQGRLLSVIQFDHDAVDDAVAELDARYAAGEGAEHADILATGTAWFRAMGE
jgi:hypothetical protein